MNRIVIGLLAAAATVTTVAPAFAQAYGPSPAYGERGYSDRDRGYGDRDRGYGDRDRGTGYGFGRDFYRGAPRSAWERLRWLQQRIERGRADGSLNPREAYRAQREIDRTREYIRDSRRRYGDLRPQDRTYVEQRLDYIRDSIRWARHNGH